MKNNLSLVLLLILAFSVRNVQAQNTLSLFEKLSAAEKPQLTLSTDLTALKANKNSGEYQPGMLTATDGKAYTVEVRPRGKFRRRISDIPPLKLKLKKKHLQAEGLVDSLNELKLVLPTTLDEAGSELVIREYLVYRMYEQLSPYSVRARLINLTLLNTNVDQVGSTTVKAILLEDEEETAARLGGVLHEDLFGLTMDSLQTEHAALTAMFQFMVGNTDWSVAEGRNLRFLRLPGQKFIPIPFDFDFCGFVAAPYATPKSGMGLRNVRERRLMGEELPVEALDAAAQKLEQHRNAMRDLCTSGLLPARNARAAAEYLDAFFNEVRGK